MKYPFDRPPTTAGRRSYRPAKLPEGEDVATLLDTALALIRKKIAVFPCQPQGKVPACGRGVLDATKDRKIVSHFWSLNPAYNIGVACGAVSGIFVVDIDGLDAEAELAKLEAKHGSLPATVESITSRGRHVWFRLPTDVDVRNSASKIAPGIDVRGDGGYCISPPSTHPSGKPYAWSVDSANAFAEPPAWLIEKIVGGNGNGHEATPPEVWRELLADGVTEGSRNSSVAKLTGHLLRRFIDPHVVHDLMQCWNATRCRPPLPEDDVTRIVNSICAKELRRRGHAG
jgi:Bifunctional DNA primase/polymerase, N-terminal/Primase C terminal 1 (PriCT-1)